jgi:hypothetical protein
MITEKKAEVIRLMKHGWELGASTHGRTNKRRYWIQKGGIDSGGESKKVHCSTFYSLLTNKYIEANGYQRWKLKYHV